VNIPFMGTFAEEVGARGRQQTTAETGVVEGVGMALLVRSFRVGILVLLVVVMPLLVASASSAQHARPNSTKTPGSAGPLPPVVRLCGGPDDGTGWTP
jgi:hypothetical protein